MMKKLQEFRILIVWINDDDELKSKCIRKLTKEETLKLLSENLANPFVEYCVVSDNQGNAKKFLQSPQGIESRKLIKKRKPPALGDSKVQFTPYLIEKYIKWKIRNGKILAARKYSGKWYFLTKEMSLCLVDIKCLVPVQWKMAFWYDENCEFLPEVWHKDNI